MITKTSEISSKTLYDKDFCQWIETTIQQVKTNQWEIIDTLNLIEELEAMVRSEKREVKNRLIVLLTHLLKWKYQPEKRSESWINTIDEQRRQINFLLEDSPSLNPYYLEIFDNCYSFARKDAAKETKLRVTAFPQIFPFNPEETLNDDYLLD